MFTLMVVGTLIAKSHPIISSIILGIAIQQAGWLGHDYGHGRGKMCLILNRIMVIVLGFSP
jgi:hypothetical protein